MHRLLAFIKQIYVVLLFLLLEGAALWCYATATPYHEAKILSRTTAVGGAISGTVADIAHFFSLPSENARLTERVAQLEEQLAVVRKQESDEDMLPIEEQYDMAESNFRYHAAGIVSMTTGRLRNYIIIDRGADDGIAPNMGVITPLRELVGHVVSCSSRYSVVMPVLNTSFGIGGRLVDNDYSCSVRWSGSSPHHAELIDLSTYSAPRAGMSVEVRSERLPEGVVIGTIEEYELNATSTAYTARVRLAANFSTIDNLLVVENCHYSEIEMLLEEM